MQHSKIIKGIDIGSSKVTTIIGQYFENEDKHNIVAVSSVDSLGFRKGQIIDLEKAANTLTSSIESAERMAGFQINDAFVSIASPQIESLNSKAVLAISNQSGEIEKNDVDRVIAASQTINPPEGKEIIHVIPRIFTVDNQEGITDPIGMNGVRLEVESHLVFASTPALKNLKKCFQEVNIDISQLVYSGLSAATSCLSDTEKELGVALIDIGGTITSITIFFQNSPVYCATIPIGGDFITNDLAIGLRLSILDAQKVKLGLSKLVKNKNFAEDVGLNQLGFKDDDDRKISLQTAITGIIKPRLEEIFSLVLEEIEKSGFKNNIPSGIVLTGGGSLSIDCQETCNKVIPLPLRLAKPAKVGGIVDNILNPSHTSSVGLLVYAQNQEGKIQKNVPKISISSFSARLKKLLQPLLP
jgi:cell division protein FtsA